MKIIELINEALPYGFGSYLKNTLRSKIPMGIAGQARASGEINRGQLTNRLYRGYFNWAGESQSPENADTLKQYLDLISFPSDVAIKQLPTQKGLGSNAAIDANDVSKVITASVQEKYRPTATAPAPTGTTTPATPTTATPPTSSSTPTPAPTPTTPARKPTPAKAAPKPTAPATPAVKPRYKLGPGGQQIRIN